MSGGIAATLGMMAPSVEGLIQVAGVAALGGGVGSIIAKRIQITDLPQLVAGFHRFVSISERFYCIFIAIPRHHSLFYFILRIS